MKLLKEHWGILLVISISLLPLIPLLHPGFPITHDGQDHVARIANFYQSLSEGNIVPRWAGNLNWGYGHPILMFLYPLSSYSASFFHFLGFSLIDSTKLVFASAFILSAVTMYLWLRSFLGVQAAVAGSLIYNFAPYRFVDLYVRGAIGEHVAFIFPPLILYFVQKISESKSFNRFYFAFLSLSVAGLVLAHNAISIMFLPFIIFYGLFLFLTNGKRKSLIYQYFAALVLGFCLSAFFLVPAYIEGKYTLRDIVTSGETLKRFVELKNLIYSPWNFGQSGVFSVQVGIVSWLAVIGSAVSIFIYKKERDLKYLVGFLLIYFFVSIFLMLPLSKPIWEIVTTLQKFQFPWRFLSVSVFCVGVLGALFVNGLRGERFRTYSLLIILVLILGTTYGFWSPKGYISKPESFYKSIYHGTTDTGESAPIWSVRFMEHTADTPAEVLEGEAKIKSISRTSTMHSYEMDAKFRSRIRENTLYFPGWRIYIDGKQYNGIQFQDPNSRGLMTYFVPSGKHRVEVAFGDTRIRTLSNMLSLGALILVVGILLKSFPPFRHPRA